MIKACDRAGIEELLTNRTVEEKLLRRLRKKALTYGQEIEDVENTNVTMKIPLDVVEKMYEEFVIPLTKEVEVEYLLRRLEFPDFEPDI